MSNPAQDEFDALVSLKEKPSHHPDDGDSTSSETEDTNSSTLVPPSASQSQYSKSLRSSTHRDSSGEDSDADNEVARRTSRPYYIPSKHGYDANTGPKGVIADARAFENEKRAGNKATYVRTENMVLPKMQRLALGAGQREARDGADDEDEDEDAMDSEGEDDYVRRWRERRAGELRTRKNSAIAAGSGGGRRGRYGSLRGVDAMGFLAAVEESSAGTVVVVFVFDDQVRLCYATNAAAYNPLHHARQRIERTKLTAELPSFL